MGLACSLLISEENEVIFGNENSDHRCKSGKSLTAGGAGPRACRGHAAVVVVVAVVVVAAVAAAVGVAVVVAALLC